MATAIDSTCDPNDIINDGLKSSTDQQVAVQRIVREIFAEASSSATLAILMEAMGASMELRTLIYHLIDESATNSLNQLIESGGFRGLDVESLIYEFREAFRDSIERRLTPGILPQEIVDHIHSMEHQ